MTAQTLSTQPPADDLTLDGDPVSAAREHVAAGALTPGTRRRVGLELEFHLVDLARPATRPTWDAVQRLVAGLPPMPSGSSVTLEPGGQVELSTRPGEDVVAAVATLRDDRTALGAALATSGHGLAAIGADPARPVRRVNPGARYAAMEEHFEAMGCAAPGRAMMSATAALQVNLDAGPEHGWGARLAHVRSLVPMLVALSATSPYLGGRTSGWHSMRQEAWYGIDHARSAPVSAGSLPEAWADYALAAPVMLVRDGEGLLAVTERITFLDWLLEPRRIGRPATLTDLEYHLTTLFPPVRPRGYLELRCIDALPDRWWPALAALAATLVDVPAAADASAEVCEPITGRLEGAARTGTDDPDLDRAVRGCVEVAARHCPVALRPEVEELAELVLSGRTPSSELRRLAETQGPLRVLEEEAHA